MLFIYRILINLIILISPLIIFIRLLNEKEDKNRLIRLIKSLDGIFESNKVIHTKFED